jgi:hypothetical protein
MIHFIIIWLVFWLIVIATLCFEYKGKYWFVRYLFFIFTPISLLGLLIACEAIRHINSKDRSFTIIFLYFLNLIVKGIDEPTETK